MNQEPSDPEEPQISAKMFNKSWSSWARSWLGQQSVAVVILIATNCAFAWYIVKVVPTLLSDTEQRLLDRQDKSEKKWSEETEKQLNRLERTLGQRITRVQDHTEQVEKKAEANTKDIQNIMDQ